MNQIERLLAIMAALRDPEKGCPWDLQQNFQTIAPYTIEEAYEVADAIERRDYADLREELGDLLLQVVYHSQLAAEAGHFTFAQVVEAISEKMVRRHPHVFGDTAAADAAAVKQNWEAEKAKERTAKQHSGALAGVALALPALKHAQKLQKRAGQVGFDWRAVAPVLDKLKEEIAELEQALARESASEQNEELGDLLFTCVNLARQLGIDAEESLRAANAKFTTRFNEVERRVLAAGKRVQDCDLDELENHWIQVKQDIGKVTNKK
jgi:ATP diphosphatase